MIRETRFASRWLVPALLIALVSWMGAAHAQKKDSPGVRYISDETVITLRQGKGVNAALASLLQSGTKVELLESDKASGYARVRVGPGREGWVLARYLSSEPGARARLVEVEGELAKLKEENARLRGDAAPAAEDSNAGAEPGTSLVSFGLKKEAIVMVTGAGLLLAGLLAGLLISALISTPRGSRDSSL